MIKEIESNTKENNIKDNNTNTTTTTTTYKKKKPLIIEDKTKLNKQISVENFHAKSRHYFIMNEGGKPVYSRYGDEKDHSSFFATLSALMAKYTEYLKEGNESEDIQ